MTSITGMGMRSRAADRSIATCPFRKPESEISAREVSARICVRLANSARLVAVTC